jgi:uncharacterized damage-inducible protein DinB
MKKQDIQVLYNYNQWANKRIFDAASGLTDDLFTAPGQFPHGGLRGTLVHALFAEWIWRTRWLGESPKARLKPEDFPTFESLHQRWLTEEAELMKFVEQVTEEQLNSPFQYSSTEGVQYENILWQAMTHVVNHGTQHRAEAAAMLTDLGRSPGDLDMILFLRKKI